MTRANGASSPRPADPARGRSALGHGLLALRTGPVADARASLLLAARLLEEDGDHEGALRARLAAAEACWAMGDAAAYREVLGRPGSARGGLLERYLRGMTAVVGGPGPDFRTGFGELRGVVEEAVSASAASSSEDDPERLLPAGAAALVLGDLAAAGELGGRALAIARAHNRTDLVPRALEVLAYAELRLGRHVRARAHAEEGVHAAREAGETNLLAHHHAVLALVASLDDDAEAVAAFAAAADATAVRHGLAQARTLTQWALARGDLARGRAPEAAARLRPLVRTGPRGGHFAVRMMAVPCFVEAALSSGADGGADREEAADALAGYAVWAELGPDPQASAQLLRCRALLAADAGEDAAAEAYFAQALARHEDLDGEFERARTALQYGQWLRRQRRPGQAREALRDAHVAFERCGAGVWAGQAEGALRATGAAVSTSASAGGAAGVSGASGRSGASGDGGSDLPPVLAQLTPQQLRIARQVAEGATNREVARLLSVSPRTVDHHLRNVFAALGVRSRVELSRLVARAEEDAG
ncbi:LuxR C-terminal-related transcriptional regulator [Streptomyces boninensis]|uniref:LuxR C-terminal-related transcriptional regulator n=1 Tax=Streptomyces boninensis TaxID=2039455 RepID=UPI003B227191